MEFNLADWLVDRHLREGRGRTVAVRDRGRSVTYDELSDVAARVGAAFLGLDVRPGDRILVAMFDSFDMAAAVLGAIRIGAVPVLVNPMLPPQDVAHVAVESGARIAVISGEKAGTIAELTQEAPEILTVIVAGDAVPVTVASAEVKAFDAVVLDAEPVPSRLGSGEEPDFGCVPVGRPVARNWSCTAKSMGDISSRPTHLRSWELPVRTVATRWRQCSTPTG